MLLLLRGAEWLTHFWPALTVAREIGLSHLSLPFDGRARRIVSEDSFHRVAPFAAAVHALSQGQETSEVGFAHGALRQHADGVPEAREVTRLRTDERKPLEEGNDRSLDVGSRLTSQYQPPFPARRIVPQPSVRMKSSRGSGSFCETLKAAEIFHFRP